jgi:hypothetical protein
LPGKLIKYLWESLCGRVEARKSHGGWNRKMKAKKINPRSSILERAIRKQWNIVF